jgi:hypothetical protein
MLVSHSHCACIEECLNVTEVMPARSNIPMSTSDSSVSLNNESVNDGNGSSIAWSVPMARSAWLGASADIDRMDEIFKHASH